MEVISLWMCWASTELEWLFAETTFGKHRKEFLRNLCMQLVSIGTSGHLEMQKYDEQTSHALIDWMESTDQALQWPICFKSLSFHTLHLDLSYKHVIPCWKTAIFQTYKSTKPFQTTWQDPGGRRPQGLGRACRGRWACARRTCAWVSLWPGAVSLGLWRRKTPSQM